MLYVARRPDTQFPKCQTSGLSVSAYQPTNHYPRLIVIVKAKRAFPMAGLDGGLKHAAVPATVRGVEVATPPRGYCSALTL